MPHRVPVRALCLALALWPAAVYGATTTADTPRDVVAAIYAREIAEMKKPSPTTSFTTRSVRTKYFSKAFDRLITDAEVKSEKEQEPGPVDFDPVISGQDGDIKKLNVVTDREESTKAVVSAHFLSFAHPTVVHYDLVRDNDGWRIDDIRGRVDQQTWSIRKILEDAARH